MTGPDPAIRAAGARDALIVATLASLAMVVFVLGWQEGSDAISVIAGVPKTGVQPMALRLAFALDTALVIGYGAGLCLLASARFPEARILALVVCIFAVLGASCDFLENAAALSGGVTRYFTMLKTGSLGIAFVLIGTGVAPGDGIERLLTPALKFLPPVFIAIDLSGIAGQGDVLVLVAALALIFGLLTLIAHRGARRG